MRRTILGLCEKCRVSMPGMGWRSHVPQPFVYLCSLIIDFVRVGLCWYQIFELPENNAWIYELVMACIMSIVPIFCDLRCLWFVRCGEPEPGNGPGSQCPGSSTMIDDWNRFCVVSVCLFSWSVAENCARS
jgi:hypothetical protein